MARLTKRSRPQADKHLKAGTRRNTPTGRVVLFIWLLLASLLALTGWWWFRGWNGSDPVNVVVSAGDELWVLAVRPEEHTLTEVKVPAAVIVDIPAYGRWKAKALWQLSRLEKRPEIAAAVGWNLLEVPVDMLIRVKAWQGGQTPYMSVLFPGAACDSGQWFRCDFWESSQRLRLISLLRSLNQKEITSVDLAELSMSRRVVDPGGSELIEIDTQRLSPLVTKWFEITRMRTSDVSLAVRNTSGETGAGSRVARQLEHVGLRVVAVTNAQEGSGIMVRSPALKKHPVVRRLTTWFDLQVAVGEFEERADILVTR